MEGQKGEIKKIRLIMPNFDENQKKILENAIKAANKDGIEVDVEYPYPSDTTHGPLTNLTLSQQEEERLIGSFVNEGLQKIIQNKKNKNEITKQCSPDPNNCELLFEFTEEDYKELEELFKKDNNSPTGGKKKKRSKKRKSLKKKRKTKKKVVKKKKATKKKPKKGKK